MKKLIQIWKNFHKKYVEGYPIVLDTAPKFNIKRNITNIRNPDFNKPFSRLNKIY